MEIKQQARNDRPRLEDEEEFFQEWEDWAESMVHNCITREDSRGGYWHQRLGLPPAVDSQHTPEATRKRFVQAFLRAAKNIRNNMTTKGFNRVLCGIAVPRIVNSDLTVFFSEDYFRNFFNRSGWSRLPPERSLQREWGLQIPSGLGEIGVRQIYDNGDGPVESETWWYGDIEGIDEQLRRKV